MRLPITKPEEAVKERKKKRKKILRDHSSVDLEADGDARRAAYRAAPVLRRRIIGWHGQISIMFSQPGFGLRMIRNLPIR